MNLKGDPLINQMTALPGDNYDPWFQELKTKVIPGGGINIDYSTEEPDDNNSRPEDLNQEG